MMKFCKECNNLLYPKENRELRVLEYSCRLCPYIERDIKDSCVFVNEIIKDSSYVFSSAFKMTKEVNVFLTL